MCEICTERVTLPFILANDPVRCDLLRQIVGAGGCTDISRILANHPKIEETNSLKRCVVYWYQQNVSGTLHFELIFTVFRPAD